jgi:hypothetical protein
VLKAPHPRKRAAQLRRAGSVVFLARQAWPANLKPQPPKNPKNAKTQQNSLSRAIQPVKIEPALGELGKRAAQLWRASSVGLFGGRARSAKLKIQQIKASRSGQPFKMDSGPLEAPAADLSPHCKKTLDRGL